MNFELLTRGEKKIIMSFEPKSISIRLSENAEIEQEKYLIMFDGVNDTFGYDGEKFYKDEYNHDKISEHTEQFADEVEKMENEGKSKQEIKDFMSNKAIHFIDRLEVIMEQEVYKKVNNLVSKL